MDQSHREHPHPNVSTYVKVALWLGLITAVEIVISYTHISNMMKSISLIVLSVIKFTAVVGYFMHLKFDNPLLRRPFILGVTLALSIYTVVLLNLLLHSRGAAA